MKSEHHPARVLAWSENAVNAPPRELPSLAVWRPEGTTVAIGLSQQPDIELDVAAMAADKVEMVRRQSGGGAVLLYRGVLCWEAWSDLDHVTRAENSDGIQATYRFLSRPIREALATFGLNAVHAGVCDISIPSENATLRKIAGTAQLRRKRQALVHGSLLVSPDLALLARYLKFPSSQPEYRDGRPHRDFCGSLAESIHATDAQTNALLPAVAEKIMECAVRSGWHAASIPAEPTKEEALLEEEKYRNPEWNWLKKRAFSP